MTDRPPEPTSRDSRQRRPVVAVFVDVTDYTAMVASGDAEDIQDNLRAGFVAASSIFSAAGGSVEKFIGDAIMALFGAQRAHHDDVDRAVAAAFAVRESLAVRQPPFRVRIGIELSNDVRALLGGALEQVHGPVVVVTAAWDDSTADAWAGAGTTPIPVAPLSSAATRELARELGLPAARLDEMAERSGGSPLFLEALRTWPDDDRIPLGVRAALTARLDGLAADIRQVVAAASVFGGRFNHESVGAMVATRDLATICDDLCRHGVFSTDGEVYWFAHKSLLDCTYETLTRRERRRLHAIAAAWLAAQPAHDDSQIASHLAGAGDTVAAAEAFRGAARAAMLRLAPHDAATLLERSAELVDEDSALPRELGHVYFACGRLDDAIGAFERAANTSIDPEDRARALAGQATAVFWTFDHDGADALASLATDLAGENPAAAAEARAALALVRSSQGRSADAAALAEESRRMASATGNAGLAAMVGTVGVFVLHHAGDSVKAVALARDVAADCRTVGHPVGVVWTLYKGGLANAALGDFATAWLWWDELTPVAREIGARDFLSEVDNCRGHVAREAGAFSEAEEHDNRCLAVAPDIDALESAANGLLNRCATALAVGDLSAASQHLDEAMPYLDARAFFRWRYRQRYRYYRARLLAESGDRAGALALAREALDLGRQTGSGKNILRPQLLLASLDAAEDSEAAEREFVRIGAEATRRSLRPIAWRAYAAAAELANRRDDQRAVTRWADASADSLAWIDGHLPPHLREPFRTTIASRVADGAFDLWTLPL